MCGRASRSERTAYYIRTEASAERSIELALRLARRTASASIVGYAAERFPDEVELRARLGALLRRAPGSVELNAFSEARIDSILETARSAHITRIVLGA